MAASTRIGAPDSTARLTASLGRASTSTAPPGASTIATAWKTPSASRVIRTSVIRDPAAASRFSGAGRSSLLGDPGYYRRFGFELSTAYQITPPRPEWQPHFQVRVLSGYQPRLRGMFTYPEPFDRT
jgi:hypothetical protein